MKFDVPLGTLRSALVTAKRVMSSNPTQVAYTGVQLRVVGDILAVTSSDGDTTITTDVPSALKSRGAAVLEPQPLITFLANVGADADARVVGALGGNDLELRLPNLRPYTFRTITATFPNPLPADDGLVAVAPELFSSAVAAVKDLDSDARRGVQVVIASDTVSLTAAGAHRLARARLVRDVPAAGADRRVSGIVDESAILEAGRHGIIAMGFTSADKLAQFRSERVTVTTALVADATFPAVDSVLKDPTGGTGTLQRRPLESALRRILSVAGETPVLLNVDGSSLRLNLTDKKLGDGEEVLDLKRSEFTEYQNGISCKFLLDAVTAHSADRIQLGWSGPNQPIQLHSNEGVDVTTAVMPIALDR